MSESPQRQGTSFADVVPAPVSAVGVAGVRFPVPEAARIVTQPESADAARVGRYLADLLGPGANAQPGGTAPIGGFALLLDDGIEGGAEAYQLLVTDRAVTIRARAATGLFWGVQTLRQLLPPGGVGSIPGGRIDDEPRFGYRGVMLDVARHFFDPATIRRLIDLSAMYKVNHIHLHLTDDQGWRIAIDTWPRLTTYGGGTEVGDGPGGYYTKDDYRGIVQYAADRFITVVPEIDLPGHTNAALASYPELNCDGVAPPRYRGTEVGFSSLCVANETTYRFLDEVFGELAELTPGPYLHIGGDEALTLGRDDYVSIVTRAQAIVAGHGKTVVGWHELAAAELATSTVLQFWGTTAHAPEVTAAARAGTKVIMSPADRTYLDMKYDEDSPLGLTWAGTVSVHRAYDWDPANYLPGVDEAAVLGVESPLWTETVSTIEDLEYLALPRLAAVAEVGWSPTGRRDWAALRARLAAQAPRWEALGINFARAGDVPWVSSV